MHVAVTRVDLDLVHQRGHDLPLTFEHRLPQILARGSDALGKVRRAAGPVRVLMIVTLGLARCGQGMFGGLNLGVGLAQRACQRLGTPAAPPLAHQQNLHYSEIWQSPQPGFSALG